ncbi:MAG TPA: hypothetical protein ENN81_08835 [Phycisphaerales bacterium]|mgnify:CR=1 FL=1|nr:hypothetical protein [Phycisphaerales bacterium]
MNSDTDSSHYAHLIIAGLLGWAIPGAGHFYIGERVRAAVIFVTVVLTFTVGLWVGSVGVIDPVHGKLPYAGQIMNSPAVAAIGHLTRSGHYPVYGRPNEIGQIYTSISGLLNLLCIVNAVYLAHVKRRGREGRTA